jgi:hypothetical protein
MAKGISPIWLILALALVLIILNPNLLSQLLKEVGIKTTTTLPPCPYSCKPINSCVKCVSTFYSGCSWEKDECCCATTCPYSCVDSKTCQEHGQFKNEYTCETGYCCEI